MYMPDILTIGKDAFDAVSETVGRKPVDGLMVLTGDDAGPLAASGSYPGPLLRQLALFAGKTDLRIGFSERVRDGVAYLLRNEDGSLSMFGEKPVKDLDGDWVSGSGSMLVSDPTVILWAFDLEKGEGPREISLGICPGKKRRSIPAIEILVERIPGRSDCSFYNGDVARVSLPNGVVLCAGAGEMRLDDIEADMRYVNYDDPYPGSGTIHILESGLTDADLKNHGRFEYREANWFSISREKSGEIVSVEECLDTYEEAIDALRKAAAAALDEEEGDD